MELIKEYSNRFYEICDERGRHGWHPLAPSVRCGWKLLKVADNKKEENKEKKKPKEAEKELF